MLFFRVSEGTKLQRGVQLTCTNVRGVQAESVFIQYLELSRGFVELLPSFVVFFSNSDIHERVFCLMFFCLSI